MERDPKDFREKRMFGEIRGVVIFLLDDDNRVFTVQEKEDDEVTGKNKGQFGVICKRSNKFDQSWAVTMMQALEHEAMISTTEMDRLIDFPPTQPEGKWETQFVDNVRATVILLRVHNPEKLMETISGRKNGCSVEHLGFLTREEFEAKDLRSGVRHVMEKLGDEIFNHKK